MSNNPANPAPAVAGTPASRLMILLRGMPGSGRREQAEQLQQEAAAAGVSCVRLCSDDHLRQTGADRYDLEAADRARRWTLDEARAAINRGVQRIIVDNLNVEPWEMRPFAQEAAASGYRIEIQEPKDAPWSRDAKALAQRCAGDYSATDIDVMLAKYQHVTVDSLLHKHPAFGASIAGAGQAPAAELQHGQTQSIEEDEPKARDMDAEDAAWRSMLTPDSQPQTECAQATLAQSPATYPTNVRGAPTAYLGQAPTQTLGTSFQPEPRQGIRYDTAQRLALDHEPQLTVREADQRDPQAATTEQGQLKPREAQQPEQHITTQAPRKALAALRLKDTGTAAAPASWQSPLPAMDDDISNLTAGVGADVGQSAATTDQQNDRHQPRTVSAPSSRTGAAEQQSPRLSSAGTGAEVHNTSSQHFSCRLSIEPASTQRQLTAVGRAAEERAARTARTAHAAENTSALADGGKTWPARQAAHISGAAANGTLHGLSNGAHSSDISTNGWYDPRQGSAPPESSEESRQPRQRREGSGDSLDVDRCYLTQEDEAITAPRLRPAAHHRETESQSDTRWDLELRDLLQRHQRDMDEHEERGRMLLAKQKAELEALEARRPRDGIATAVPAPAASAGSPSMRREPLGPYASGLNHPASNHQWQEAGQTQVATGDSAEQQQKIKQIREMGLHKDESLIRQALAQSNWDISDAVDYLLAHPHVAGNADAGQQPGQPGHHFAQSQQHSTDKSTSRPRPPSYPAPLKPADRQAGQPASSDGAAQRSHLSLEELFDQLDALLAEDDEQRDEAWIAEYQELLSQLRKIQNVEPTELEYYNKQLSSMRRRQPASQDGASRTAAVVQAQAQRPVAWSAEDGLTQPIRALGPERVVERLYAMLDNRDRDERWCEEFEEMLDQLIDVDHQQELKAQGEAALRLARFHLIVQELQDSLGADVPKTDIVLSMLPDIFPDVSAQTARQIFEQEGGDIDQGCAKLFELQEQADKSREEDAALMMAADVAQQAELEEQAENLEWQVERLANLSPSFRRSEIIELLETSESYDEALSKAVRQTMPEAGAASSLNTSSNRKLVGGSIGLSRQPPISAWANTAGQVGRSSLHAIEKEEEEQRWRALAARDAEREQSGAWRLRVQRLLSDFPSVTPSEVENALRMSGYDEESARKRLQASYGSSGIRSLPASHQRSRPPPAARQAPQSTEEEATAARKRAREMRHNYHRFMERAATCTGGHGVAAFYASEAQRFRREMRLANIKAARCFAEQTLNKTHSSASVEIDLHHLYVDEAVEIVKEFLAHYRELKRQKRPVPRSLLLITGAGHHSTGGQAKLLPVVSGELRRQGVYDFEQTNGGGALVVSLRSL